ncbi:MAG: DoxX family protein [Haloechinothrix sp.]
MELGLLLLRLLLSALIFGHGAQKLFGWFGGLGPDGTAPLFEGWGFRPGRTLVVLAALSEITAAVLLAFGVLTPLGAAIAFGTMLVAASVNCSKGLWAQAGGYELPLVYAGIAAAIAFIGPGGWSVDHLILHLSFSGVAWGAAAVAAGLGAAACLIGYAARNRAPARSAV